MLSWTAVNIRLRADRDTMDEQKRRETDAGPLLTSADAAIAANDCRCTIGTVCRDNAACPRLAGAAAGA